MNFLNEYLKKVRLESGIEPVLGTISKLQSLHLQTFPFENLNPLFHREVKLDSDSLAEKFLNQNRGGYCFEQNLIFKRVLEEIGFNVRALMARVYTPNQVLGRTHLLLLVEFESKKYITDVGFGGLVCPQPLWLDTWNIQETELGWYKIIKKGNEFSVNILQGDWRELYSFNLETCYFNDLVVANHYTSTHPNSHFTHDLMVALKTGNGRISLRNFQFSAYKKSELVNKVELKSVEELKTCLFEKFHLSTDEFPEFDTKLSEILSSEKDEREKSHK